MTKREANERDKMEAHGGALLVERRPYAELDAVSIVPVRESDPYVELVVPRVPWSNRARRGATGGEARRRPVVG